MSSIKMTNIPRPRSDKPAAPSLPASAPAKRKADEISSTNENDDTAKRQKTTPAQSNPGAPKKTPRAPKTFKRAPNALSVPAQAGAANSAPPAETPTTAPAPAPASSAASKSPAAIESETAQPSAASTQAVSREEVHVPSPPTHTYRPSACFTQALPSPIAPWPHAFAAPTPRLAHSLTSCPVDWTKVSGLEPHHIDAYELRAPWNPRPVTFSAVAAQTQFLNGKGEQPVEEGVRKRFKTANLAVFQCSGVYFEESHQGLGKQYGVVKPARKKTASAAPRSARDAAAKPATKPSQTAAPAGSLGEAAIYQGEVVAVQLQTATDDHPSVRICDAKLIPSYEELITHEELLDDNDEPYLQAMAPCLPFSTEAFDHWHSSVCLGRAQEFPTRTLICREIDDAQYMLRVNSNEHTASPGLMLETYVVSRAMGTTRASKMIMGALADRLKGAPKSALSPKETSMLQFFHSDDPVYAVVNDFLRTHAGSSSSSEHSVRDEDEYL